MPFHYKHRSTTTVFKKPFYYVSGWIEGQATTMFHWNLKLHTLELS